MFTLQQNVPHRAPLGWCVSRAFDADKFEITVCGGEVVGEFPISYNWKNVVLEFTVTLVTRSLSLNEIPDAQITRLELFTSLYKKGLSSVEIDDYLNERGVSTP